VVSPRSRFFVFVLPSIEVGVTRFSVIFFWPFSSACIGRSSSTKLPADEPMFLASFPKDFSSAPSPQESAFIPSQITFRFLPGRFSMFFSFPCPKCFQRPFTQFSFLFWGSFFFPMVFTAFFFSTFFLVSICLKRFEPWWSIFFFQPRVFSFLVRCSIFCFEFFFSRFFFFSAPFFAR